MSASQSDHTLPFRPRGGTLTVTAASRSGAADLNPRPRGRQSGARRHIDRLLIANRAFLALRASRWEQSDTKA